jgi:hypothetical protein
MPKPGEYLNAAKAAGWGIVHATGAVEASMAAQSRTMAARKQTIPPADGIRSPWEAQRDLATMEKFKPVY